MVLEPDSHTVPQLDLVRSLEALDGYDASSAPTSARSKSPRGLGRAERKGAPRSGDTPLDTWGHPAPRSTRGGAGGSWAEEERQRRSVKLVEGLNALDRRVRCTKSKC